MVVPRRRTVHTPLFTSRRSAELSGTTWTAALAERRRPLTIKPDPSKAAQAGRLLIRAYLDGPDGVEWSDVQDALTGALQACHLPETFVETEGGRWQEGTALRAVASETRRRIQCGNSL